MPFRNRITELLGIEIPVVQAPMGWIARSQLASAVSNAGGLGVIETSSGELDAIRDEIRKMHDLTDKPFAVNIAQAFVRDPDIVQFVVDQGVKFVTTSAGSPTKYTGALKEAGLTVFHVVPTLDAALKAIDAGVDFPRLLWAMSQGRTPAPHELGYRVGLRERWWLGDLDHLYLRLRHDSGLRARWQALRVFLAGGGPQVINEVRRPDDAAPFWFELRSWLRRLIHV